MMLDYKQTIETYSSDIGEQMCRLSDSLLRDTGRRRCYLLGRNSTSQQLAQKIAIDGFIDDFAPRGSSWHGKPVLPLEEAERDAVIVNCALSIKPRTADARIRAAGFAHVLSYSDLCRTCPDLVPLPDFVAQTREDIAAHSEKWIAVYDSLADDESKTVFNDLLRYRLTADHAALAAYRFRPQDQYFEDFMGFDKEVFIDAGGFNGDTTEQFCLRYPDYRQVWLFEPSPQNIALARQRLARFHSIEFIEQGVSDQAGTLYFRSGDGSACSVSDQGDCAISVTTIDECVSGPVSFIKMDLEGWESKALQGARQCILNGHPKLAIAVYHHPADLWRIFDLVIGIRPDYQVFLRHYTEGWSETVMYFLPAPRMPA